jgi:glycolate dehydrogenase iron-sulfur subunit
MAVTEPEITTPHGVTAAESPGLQGFLNERDYEALVKCVHCGLCLNQCPTYRANGLEPDSPRGRLYLIRAVSEGTLPVTDEVVDHLQLCLVCRACETACPSNVQFGQVMEAARHELLEHHASRKRKIASWLAFRYLFPAPHRLKAVGQLLRFYQRSPMPAVLAWARGHNLVPAPLRRLVTMEQLAPPLSERFFEPQTERVPATAERRFTVGMISGCIMPLAFAPTNEATVRVLTANGCDVILPRAQRCCGALAAHSGDGDASNDLARANIDAFEAFGLDRLDSIIINAAGCGAQLKNYGHMLQDDPRYAERAARFAAKVEDISEFLVRAGLTAPLGEVPRTVTYQDACHLVHGQKVRSQPRELLLSIPGLDLVEMQDPDRCCGSAGIYNIVQPGMSQQVLDAKMENVLATGTDCVVAGNPGCLLPLNLGLKQHGRPPEAVHLVDLLDESIRAARP